MIMSLRLMVHDHHSSAAQDRVLAPHRTQHLLLEGELATAEPKMLRYRLLHVAARITRTARRTRLRIAEGRPWAGDLVNAFTRLTAPPRPIT